MLNATQCFVLLQDVFIRFKHSKRDSGSINDLIVIV